MTDFSQKILTWFDQHGRKDLPWQQDINPYRVWVSEIMLQQTQVKTVIPYFQRFMQSFPTVLDLASATQDDVLMHWSGLGYYARGRNLHKAAGLVRDEFEGVIPETLDTLEQLPGIGRSTAGAILSIACKQSHPILDGNVKRVLARFYAVEGWTGKVATQKQLWKLAEQNLPQLVGLEEQQRNADYTQAMMDLGATLCTRTKPRCVECPLNTECVALKEDKVQHYPTPKPKKVLPEKQAIMLLMQNAKGEILMQKRPPVGIWGGLWCFPQFDDKENAAQWLKDQIGLSLNNASVIAPFNHTFSHFKLVIQPYHVNLGGDLKNHKQTPLKLGVMEADDSFWYNITTEFNGGLAAPVQKLLKQLRN